MWQEEGYAFQVFIPSKRDYCICDSWISQGYEIKALYLKEKSLQRKSQEGMDRKSEKSALEKEYKNKAAT